MESEIEDPRRRQVLVASAAALAAGLVGSFAGSGRARAAGAGARAGVGALPPVPRGKIGEFNFLAGSWRIQNRKRKGKGWDEFPGESTCWTILGGVGSIEELRIPARDFSGMGIRLLDQPNQVWNDFWVNGKSGVLAPPGLTGGFENGVGTFIAEDMDGDKPLWVRGVWNPITPTSCRWHQGASRDGGKTWDDDWVMIWTRVA